MEDYKSEYDRDVTIDRDALDKELVFHGAAFMKWSERLANAIEERDIKKAKIEVKKAELDKEIRSDPKKFNLEKITETAISTVIVLDKETQELNLEYIKHNKNVNILTWAKEEMQNKRKKLERLVELWLGQYWSEPKLKIQVKNELDNRMRKRRKIT